MAENFNNVQTEGFKWTKNVILKLISLVKENYGNIENGVKKNAYMDIAKEINKIFGTNVSHEQVDSKWKGLKKTYKKIKEDNKATGQSRKYWEYFELMDEILFRAPEVNPPAVLSSDEPIVLSGGSDDACTEQLYETNFRKRRRVRNTEDAIERRHREKMEAKNKFLDLFQKMIDKM